MQTRWMIPDYAKSMSFVRVQGGWELIIEWDDKAAPNPAMLQPSGGCNLPAVRTPSAAAIRQRRYRENKRNASSGVTPVTRDVTRDVTNVTRTVTGDVTCYVTQGINPQERKKESDLNLNNINHNTNNINNINNINNQKDSFFPSLKPEETVTRDVTCNVTRPVTGDANRNVPQGVKLSNPSTLIPASMPESMNAFPKVIGALEEYFEERCFDGKPQLWPDYETRLWVFLGKCIEKLGEDKTVEVLQWNAEHKQWFTLKLPDEWLKKEEPPSRYETPQTYDAGEDISPEESAEVSRSIKDFISKTFGKRKNATGQKPST